MSNLPFPIKRIITAYQLCDAAWHGSDSGSNTFKQLKVLYRGKTIDYMDTLRRNLMLNNNSTEQVDTFIDIYMKLRRDEFPEPLRTTK